MEGVMKKKAKLRAAYITPHPPIIIPEIGRGEEEKIKETSEALRHCAQEVRTLQPKIIIMITPHAKLYRGAMCVNTAQIISGSFASFGRDDVKFSANNAVQFVQALVGACKEKNIVIETPEMPLDHGAFVPLYFIAKEYTDFSLVHINYGILSKAVLKEFGTVLANLIETQSESAVCIASGDLSHRLLPEGPYGFAKEGPKFDKKICDIIQSGNFTQFEKIDSALADGAGECGLNSFLILSGMLTQYLFTSDLLSYQGTFGVGYAVGKIKIQEYSPSATISDYAFHTESEPHIALALKSIKHYLQTGSYLQPDMLPEDIIHKIETGRAGTFVSLKKEGDLRGCIGTIAPVQKSIVEEIIHNAVSAALRDPRFSPVRMEELSDIQCSVDILKEPEPINSITELDVKKYGVIVSSGYKRGLLLPNLEGVDTPTMQVRIALQKAGIPSDTPYILERFEVIRYE